MGLLFSRKQRKISTIIQSVYSKLISLELFEDISWI